MSGKQVLMVVFVVTGHPSSILGLGSSPGEGIQLTTPVFLDLPSGSDGKESTCYVGDLGLIPGLGRSPGEENGYPLQYSSLENSMDCIDHGVAKNWTQLSNFHFTSESCPRLVPDKKLRANI